MILKIEPEYKVRNTIRITLFTIGFALILLEVIFKETEGLYFFSVIMFGVGGFISVFSSKNRLIIDKKLITVETKSIIDGAKTLQIEFSNIKNVRFLKKQFLLLGGRNPLADADAQTLYHTNRIVLTTKEDMEEVIRQIGALRRFKEAFSIIEQEVSDLSKTGADL